MKITEKRWYWLLVGMASGLVSLALEICAARLLAPHFGTSTIVWSSIIGVVLLALSTGYFVGGKLAERKLDEQILLRILATSGLVILLVPTLAKYLLGAISVGLSENVYLFVTMGSVLASLLLFGLPVFLLGLVSPYLITLLASKYGHLGNTAGQLFSLSTLGSLAGTFLPTLVFIPWVGTNYTILGTGLLLLLVALPGLKKHKTSILALTLVLSFAVGRIQTFTHATNIAEAESLYQHIEISATHPEQITMQFDAGMGFQSVYNKNTFLTGFYYDYTVLLPAITKPINNTSTKVLCIGLAGGTIPRLLHHYYGNGVSMEAVEIDAVATKLAKTHMGLAEIPLLVHTQDGRQFLNFTKDQYDIIYVDAYQNELQIPWTLTTEEFWQTTKKRITSGGLVAMNIAALGQVESSLVSAITNTANKIFPFVYDVPLTNQENSNHLILMSNAQVDINGTNAFISEHPELLPLKIHLEKYMARTTYSQSLPTLTDDHAPIDWLMAKDSLK